MKKDDIRDSMENQFNSICTFSPQTNFKELIFNESSKSVYKRLFEDHSRRKYNSQLNLKKVESECENMANKKHLKNLDRKRIEKLYLDHKKNKVHKTVLQKNFDEQAGITFKPLMPNVDKYEITNDFYQRNDILLHKKNIFSDWYQKILKENFETKKKSYTVEQADEIKNNIIERLYKKDLQKIIDKNQFNSEKEKFDYKLDLRNNQNLYNTEVYQNYPKNNSSNNYTKINNKKSSYFDMNSSRSKSKNSTKNNNGTNTNNNLNNSGNILSSSSNYFNNNNNYNSIGMRFSFKNDYQMNAYGKNPEKQELLNSDYMGNSENESNQKTIKNFNNNLSNRSNNYDSNNNFNSISKNEESNNENEGSVITEIENNNLENSSRKITDKNNRKNYNKSVNEYDLIRKNLTNDNISNDKKFKTIDNTLSTNGNINISNTHQNRKPRDSEALLNHFTNNKNKNINKKDFNLNNNFNQSNNVNTNEAAVKNNIYNKGFNTESNNNLILNHISIASPANILSTKSTNNYGGNSNNNFSPVFSNNDQFNGENNNFESINQEYERKIQLK